MGLIAPYEAWDKFEQIVFGQYIIYIWEIMCYPKPIYLRVVPSFLRYGHLRWQPLYKMLANGVMDNILSFL